jgi:glycosyltransferase involved in cell wall biosynthesis
MSKLTIIIPSYNHAEFLKDRLDSIQEQTFTDWELIIIDDCSSDESVVILEDFADKNKDKVRYFIKNKINSGSGYSSWEKGIGLAITKYIWIAETDDFAAPTFLEEQIQLLDNTNAVLSFCTSNYVDVEGNYLYSSAKRTEDLQVAQASYKVFDYQVFMNNMPFDTYITNGSSVVFRKPKEIPSIVFKYKQSSDQFIWSYLIQNNSFSFLNKNLNNFRRHSCSTTFKNDSLNSKEIYIEKIHYINFFNQSSKYKIFLKYYIEYYVLRNKFKVFDIVVLKNFKGVPLIYISYFLILFKISTLKFFQMIWK